MLNNKKLHIISFNIPYPADYGGVIDIYYKIRALINEGVSIILHCFEYGRERSVELENICEKVYYYKRLSGFRYLLSLKPYIVLTRQNKTLLQRLSADNYPVLIEGLHTSYYINHPDLKDKFKLLRSHNIEHEYYQHLSSATSKINKKLFFKLEAFKLKYFEKAIFHADCIAGISKAEYKYYKNFKSEVEYIPAFHEYNSMQCKYGKGIYVLYHGNLSVYENIKAVHYLILNIFSKLKHQVIVAGKNPDISIKKLCSKFDNIKLIPDPTSIEMNILIRDAHINVLFTFQSTGIKLKLLNTLYNGKFCIVNSKMVEGTNLNECCIVEDKPEKVIDEIDDLFQKGYDIDNGYNKLRKEVLHAYYSNSKNAKKIVSIIYP